KQLVSAKKKHNFKEFLRDPLRAIKERPMLSLIFTIPLAFIFAVVMIFTDSVNASVEGFQSQAIWTTIALFIIPLMIVSVPLSFFHEIKKR
ncbi:MAG: hypothetical protein SV377_07240, partial [Halobacteria archaeon]|nr:hypothetical protein [Halobacteria archaeon]